MEKKLYCALCGTKGPSLICENCGIILCYRCVETVKKELTICQACGSLDISEGKNQNRFCLKCKSEQVGSGSKIQRHCPSCKGTVHNICHVKQRVISRFLEILKYFKGIGTQFVKLCAKWEQLRERIQTLRKFNYYHYPRLENKMVSVYDKLPEYGRFVYNQVNLIAKKMKNESEHFIGSSFENSAKKMEQLDSLEKELEIVFNTVKERQKIEKETMDHLEKLIEKLEKYRDYFDQLNDILDMDPFELPVMVLPHVHVSNFRTINDRRNGMGAICLTNSRLAYITRQGTFRKTKKSQSIQINHILRVFHENKKRKNRLNIITSMGTIEIEGRKDADHSQQGISFWAPSEWSTNRNPFN